MKEHALADMQRVVDVLHSSMGPTGRLSVAASIKLASLCVTNGNLLAAEETLMLPIPLEGNMLPFCLRIRLKCSRCVAIQISPP